jgi:Nucleotidyltransferase substrate binding protein like
MTQSKLPPVTASRCRDRLPKSLCHQRSYPRPDASNHCNEALAIPLTNPLAIDGTIYRFEFSFELAWKAIKTVAMQFGEDKRPLRDAVKAASGFSWIDGAAIWLAI